MTVRVYRNTDTNAPSLTGQAGKLIDVLSACLVNGYAMPSITSITRSGATATILFSAVHGLVSFGNRLTVSGADQADYNGEFEITVVDTTSVSYTVANSPATPATGTITVTKPGSGWTVPFTGTNLAAYLQGAGGNARYLRVDDTGTTDGRVVGYETMSGVNTGTGPFPTAAQIAGGGFFRKSSLGDATTRAWIVVATQKAFYIWIDQQAGITTAHLYFFGVYPSYKPADAYNDVICCNSSGPSNNGVMSIVAGFTNSVPGNYMVRSHSQVGGSVAMGKSIDVAGSLSTGTIGANGETYPSLITGGLVMSQVLLHETSQGRRGFLPGILAPLHNRPLTHLDTFTGTGNYAGKRYLALTHNSSGQSFVEISNTW